MVAKMWKRLPPASWIFIAAVLILLPVLAWYQHSWLGQLSDSQRERMNALLRSASSQFSQAFDAEITRAYSTFQRQKTGEVTNLAWEYAQRLEEWNSSSSYPRLVANIFLVEVNEVGAVSLMQLNPSAGSLAPIEWPSEMAALRQQLAQSIFDPLCDEPPALIIRPADSLSGEKEVDSPAPRLLATIVVLDSQYLTQKFLPTLISRYFPTEEGLSYNVAVVSAGDSRKLIFESQAQLLSSPRKGEVETPLFDLHLETFPNDSPNENIDIQGANHSPMLLRIIRQNSGAMRSGREVGGEWRLLVSYKPGLLEEKIANSRARNLAISFGVLLLLALSSGLLVVSSARAMRLAQDQLRFVAGVSHELRTPLGVICSAGENLADGIMTKPDKVQEYGRVIRDNGRRLARMVEQVLEYTGAQSGRQIYDVRPIRVREVCNAAIAELHDKISNSEITIDTQIEPNLPLVMADFVALKRALQNLISNAIKYDIGRRQITISAQRTRPNEDCGEIQISVADQGRGIPRSELPRIFDPFYRGADVIAAQIMGSGLGLSLVRHAVAGQGGRVTVESILGQGSTFTIYLPMAETTEVAHTG